MASSCARGHLDQILGKISSEKGLQALNSLPREVAESPSLKSIPKTCGCGTWTWFNDEHGDGARLMVGLDDPKDLFQPL